MSDGRMRKIIDADNRSNVERPVKMLPEGTSSQEESRLAGSTIQI